MLINARSSEEIRVAIVDNKRLENYQVEIAERNLTRGNIYRGSTVSIQPSLNAAFIDYGAKSHGFLPIQDVVPAAYCREVEKTRRPRIDEVLERGRPILVQVSREPEGTKGAALTTNLSLAGRYLVLRPFDEVQGVSRKVEDDGTRRRLKDQAAKLNLPPGCGVIVRTNALDQNKATLSRDLSALLRLWRRIKGESRQGKGIKLLYRDQDLILRALRDYLDPSIQEVLTDDDQAHAKVRDYMRAFMPRSKTQLIRYEDRTPLFARYELDPQIDHIYERRVDLPSGGSLVIDRTEALTAIDVNSGRSTRAASQDQTALHTNLEAVLEIARQLRLRDIGGLIVVDLIDMAGHKQQRDVEKALKEAMKTDKARFNIGRISANGLLEINRQRIQQELRMRTHRACPTCNGTGRIASPEMVGLNLLRRLEARAAMGFRGGVRIALHPELADSFQNGRRQEIAELEREFQLKVEVIASSGLHRADLEIEWVASGGQEPKGEAKANGGNAPAKAATPEAPPSSRQRSASRRRRRRRQRKRNAETPPAS